MTNPDTPDKKQVTYLSNSERIKLTCACKLIAEAFQPSYGPYLVGSVLERPDYRDVDVRLMLEDKHFERLFDGAWGWAARS